MSAAKKTEKEMIGEVEAMINFALGASRKPQARKPKPKPRRPAVCTCTPEQRAADQEVATCEMHNGMPF